MKWLPRKRLAAALQSYQAAENAIPFQRKMEAIDLKSEAKQRLHEAAGRLSWVLGTASGHGMFSSTLSGPVCPGTASAHGGFSMQLPNPFTQKLSSPDFGTGIVRISE